MDTQEKQIFLCLRVLAHKNEGSDKGGLVITEQITENEDIKRQLDGDLQKRKGRGPRQTNKNPEEKKENKHDICRSARRAGKSTNSGKTDKSVMRETDSETVPLFCLPS